MTFYDEIMAMDIEDLATLFATMMQCAEDKILKELSKQGISYEYYTICPDKQIEIYKRMLERNVEEI